MNNNKVETLFSLRGRRAIVTGGTKGLGAAIAQCLVDNGCDVAALSRHGNDPGALAERRRSAAWIYSSTAPERWSWPLSAR